MQDEYLTFLLVFFYQFLVIMIIVTFTLVTFLHVLPVGYYVYIETSSPRRLGDKAIISRWVSLTGKSCLSFFYHMRGSGMGTLRVKLCDAVISEKSGNQGSNWLKQELRLQGSGTKKVNFIADVLSCGERPFNMAVGSILVIIQRQSKIAPASKPETENMIII